MVAWIAAVISPVVGLAVALPYHYTGTFQHNWVSHLGPIYVATLVFVVGALLALRDLMRGASGVALAGTERKQGAIQGWRPDTKVFYMSGFAVVGAAKSSPPSVRPALRLVALVLDPINGGHEPLSVRFTGRPVLLERADQVME